MTYIIALDGPSGSGKSTIAKELSERLTIEYLNTGSMYRAVTKYFLDKNIKEEDLEKYSLPIIEISELETTGHKVNDLVSLQFVRKVIHLIEENTYTIQ